MTRYAIVTVAAALHVLRDLAEADERTSADELRRRARQSIAHLDPRDPVWARFDEAVTYLRDKGVLS